jgi:protein-tyrosine-phosphatase
MPRYRLRLGDADLVASGRHRLGLPMVPTAVGGLPPRCDCGGDASRGDHAMTCNKLQGYRTLRHDMLTEAVRLSVNSAGLSSVAEARVPPTCRAAAAAAPPAGAEAPARAQAVPVNARADILVAMAHHHQVHVDVSVVHTTAASFVEAASLEAGAAAKARDRQKRDHYRRRGFVQAFELVPFSVETFGRLGDPAMGFLNTLGTVAAAGGRVSKKAFVEGALRSVSVALCKGNGLMYTASLQRLVRGMGRAFRPGGLVAVPGDD